MDDRHDDRATARMKRLRQHPDACFRRYEQAQQEKTQSLSSTDESESDGDDGSEYIPTPPSSDSEDWSDEGPDFPKDREIKVNKINTSFAQDELDVDSGDDLEHATDEGNDEKEEGLTKITQKMRLLRTESGVFRVGTTMSHTVLGQT
ncbi:unnamed protein product [Leuciscus chuanchicus]